MTENENTPFEGWAILELMGHRRLAGKITEATIAGATFVRLDVPETGEELAVTQFYSPQAVYCITPATEEYARRMSNLINAAPVSRFKDRQLEFDRNEL